MRSKLEYASIIWCSIWHMLTIGNVFNTILLIYSPTRVSWWGISCKGFPIVSHENRQSIVYLIYFFNYYTIKYISTDTCFLFATPRTIAKSYSPLYNLYKIYNNLTLTIDIFVNLLIWDKYYSDLFFFIIIQCNSFDSFALCGFNILIIV